MTNDLTESYTFDEITPEKVGSWMRFAECPKLGQPAPDFPLWEMNQQKTCLCPIWIANLYTSDCTTANSVANAIDFFLNVASQRKKEPLVPFNGERLDYRKNDRAAFYTGLERNGPKTLKEFQEAFGR